MDTMGALALATEDPNKELLDDQPHGRWGCWRCCWLLLAAGRCCWPLLAAGCCSSAC
jgi:hypothetical protein